LTVQSLIADEKKQHDNTETSAPPLFNDADGQKNESIQLALDTMEGLFDSVRSNLNDPSCTYNLKLVLHALVAQWLYKIKDELGMSKLWSNEDLLDLQLLFVGNDPNEFGPRTKKAEGRIVDAPEIRKVIVMTLQEAIPRLSEVEVVQILNGSECSNVSQRKTHTKASLKDDAGILMAAIYELAKKRVAEEKSPPHVFGLGKLFELLYQLKGKWYNIDTGAVSVTKFDEGEIYHGMAHGVCSLEKFSRCRLSSSLSEFYEMTTHTCF